MDSSPTKVGVAITCRICGNYKAPRGRSAPMESSYCDFECEGYYAKPQVGSLWWGETDADFGYPCSDTGTRKMTEQEIEAWHKKQQED